MPELMSTDRSYNVTNMAGGSYYHFGIENALIAELTSLEHLANVTDALTLRININGLPLFRSSIMSLWPILGRIKDIPECNVFIRRCIQTRKCARVFTRIHCRYEAVSQSGIVYNGVHFRVASPIAFICDALARVFLKCSKGHMGYYRCERCTQKGQYMNGKVVYPEISAELRIDEQFGRQGYQQHQRSASPLNYLGIGLVTSFVLDYMHLVCLGAMRKLIFLWLKGPLKCSGN